MLREQGCGPAGSGRRRCSGRGSSSDCAGRLLGLDGVGDVAGLALAGEVGAGELAAFDAALGVALGLGLPERDRPVGELRVVRRPFVAGGPAAGRTPRGPETPRPAELDRPTRPSEASPRRGGRRPATRLA